MTYTVKTILEKIDADVLLEHYLGPLGDLLDIFTDSKVIAVEYYRNDNRNYGEIIMSWESEKTYQDWDKSYELIHREGKTRMEQYWLDMNIQYRIFYPPHIGFAPYNGSLNKIDFMSIFIT
jgi:hypothetical protein